MEEYNKINWRENLIQDLVEVHEIGRISKEAYEESFMNQDLNGTLDAAKIREEIRGYNNRCQLPVQCPGHQYYCSKGKLSKFNTIEHLRLIEALKCLQSGRTRRTMFEKGDIELLNNSKQMIMQENVEYLKTAQEGWIAIENKGIKMNADLFRYALSERMRKLGSILKMPQFYIPVDLLPWSSSEGDVNIEMIHTANVMDLGIVSQYTPPLLTEPFHLNSKLLPESKETDYYSKLPISIDKNIEGYFAMGAADVAISLSALKKLLHYTETNQLWTIPILIKNIQITNPQTNTQTTKKVIFFDKPLVKQIISKIDLNERVHKLLVRSNCCRAEGFRFQQQDLNTEINPEKESIIHNVAYKLWNLQQETVDNCLLKKNFNPKSFKILVRTKVDACQPSEHGLQGITVVPKLEYQLKFGGNTLTKKEIVDQWTDLYFRPNSLLQRVRTHYMTSEVVKIDTACITNMNMEAHRQNMKMQSGLCVLYKLLLGFENHNEGVYLLRHELKHGGFVGLFKKTEDNLALNVFDLHKEFKTETQIVDPYHKKWCPIDVNVLLPAFDEKGHFPGLFRPRLRSQQTNFKRKKNNKNIKKINKNKKWKGKCQQKLPSI